MSAILFFEKEAVKKTQIFHIFKGPLFPNGCLYWYECWCLLRDFCGLSKKCGSRNIPKVMPIWMSKVGQNLTAFK